jgi:hypothetical protein
VHDGVVGLRKVCRCYEKEIGKCWWMDDRKEQMGIVIRPWSGTIRTVSEEGEAVAVSASAGSSSCCYG